MLELTTEDTGAIAIVGTSSLFLGFSCEETIISYMDTSSRWVMSRVKFTRIRNIRKVDNGVH